MKKTIYIITLLTGSFCFAQETIIPIEERQYTDDTNGHYYFKDINNVLDKFVGTWKYETTDESLEITFYKVFHESYGNDFTDELDCDFIYIKNGITVFDTNTINPDDKYFITGGSIRNSTKINLVYSEPTSPRDWRASLILDYIPAALGAPEKLDWFVKTFAKKTVNGEKVYPFEIPYSLILEKQ